MIIVDHDRINNVPMIKSQEEEWNNIQKIESVSSGGGANSMQRSKLGIKSVRSE
jgi:hypothetical protein